MKTSISIEDVVDAEIAARLPSVEREIRGHMAGATEARKAAAVALVAERLRDHYRALERQRRQHQ